jgi:hypothetical protein
MFFSHGFMSFMGYAHGLWAMFFMSYGFMITDYVWLSYFSFLGPFTKESSILYNLCTLSGDSVFHGIINPWLFGIVYFGAIGAKLLCIRFLPYTRFRLVSCLLAGSN